MEQFLLVGKRKNDDKSTDSSDNRSKQGSVMKNAYILVS
jgi:hypothetical protein